MRTGNFVLQHVRVARAKEGMQETWVIQSPGSVRWCYLCGTWLLGAV
jgi:hypothetical protein